MSDRATMPNLDADLTREREEEHTCHVCGCPAEIVSDEREGTSYYQPDAVRLARQAAEEVYREGLDDLKAGLLEAVVLINSRLRDTPGRRKRKPPTIVSGEEWQP